MAGYAQRSFLGGETAPALLPRSDQAKRVFGVRTMRNWYPNRSGAAENRAGTKYMGQSKDQNSDVRLIDWEFSTDQAYTIEFGAGYLRIMFEDDYVRLSSDDVDLWQDSLAWSRRTIVEYPADSLEFFYCVTPQSASTGITPSSANGAARFWYQFTDRILELPTPYAQSDLEALDYKQSGDVMWITSQNHPPFELIRFGALDWSFVPMRFAPSSDAPTTIAATSSGDAGSKTLRYKVSAITKGSKAESLPGAHTTTGSATLDLGTVSGSDLQFNDVGHGLDDGDEIVATVVAPTSTSFGWEEIKILLEGRVFRVTAQGADAFSLDGTQDLITGPTLDPGNEPDVTVTWARAYLELTSKKIPEGAGGTSVAFSWTAVADAQEYFVYRSVVDSGTGNIGEYGFIGATRLTEFEDSGTQDVKASDVVVIDPDYEIQPQAHVDPFIEGDWPGIVGLHQQRLVFASSALLPVQVWMSRAGDLRNFSTRTPSVDTDALQFGVTFSRVNKITSIESLGSMLIVTDGGVIAARGADGAGQITATGGPELEIQGYVGASSLKPVVADATFLYFEQFDKIVREIGFDLGAGSFSGYIGRDITVWSTHLFEGHTVVDWAFARVPVPIVWAVRSDGVMLGLTYMPEHDVWAWHRHDTGDDYGLIRRVSVVPSAVSKRDVAYLLVERLIDGSTVFYREKMMPRIVNAPGGDNRLDCFFLDCALTFDGTNTDETTTLTLTGGSTWAAGETGLTLTATAGTPFPGDSSNVGNGYRLSDAAGNEVECVVTTDGSTTVQTVKLLTACPAGLQATASTTDWVEMVDDISGLDHLEGQTVGICADMYDLGTATVLSGAIATLGLPSGQQGDGVVSGGSSTTRPYGIIHVGLPIVADLEPWDPAFQTDDAFDDRKKRVNGASLWVEDTRGLKVGPDAAGLLGNLREPHESKTALLTQQEKFLSNTTWNRDGRILIRQAAPLPATVRGIITHIDTSGGR